MKNTLRNDAIIVAKSITIQVTDNNAGGSSRHTKIDTFKLKKTICEGTEKKLQNSYNENPPAGPNGGIGHPTKLSSLVIGGFAENFQCVNFFNIMQVKLSKQSERENKSHNSKNY